AKSNAGGGSVAGTGTGAQVAAVPTKTVTGNKVGLVTISASSGTVTADSIDFTVVHAGADHITITGSTADLVSGIDRELTATIYELRRTHVRTPANRPPRMTSATTKLK